MSADLAGMDVQVILHADGKGIFDVTVDGKLVFSKYETHRFPEPGEIRKLIGDP